MFLCYCYVLQELDMDFDKVQEKETEAPVHYLWNEKCWWITHLKHNLNLSADIIVLFVLWLILHLNPAEGQLYNSQDNYTSILIYTDSCGSSS